MVTALVSWTEKLKDFIKVFRIPLAAAINFIALLLITLIALLIRLYPLIAYGPSLRAYDTFIQFEAARFIEEHGLKEFLTAIDYMVWYPWGRRWNVLYIGVPLTGALIHKLLALLGYEVDLLSVVAVIPAIFGSLTVIWIYLIAKELKSSRAGLFAAFLAAVSPGLIQRTLVGFYDNEAIGIFLIFLTLYLFIMAYKRESAILAALSGITLGLLGWTWGLYRYIVDLLALFIIVLWILGKLDDKVALTYTIATPITLGLIAILPRNYGILLRADGLLALLALFIIIINYLASFIGEALPGGKREAYRYILAVGLTGMIILTIYLYATGQLITLGGKFLSVINPALRNALPTFSSVSENQPASRFIVVAAPILAIPAGIAIDYILDPFTIALRKEWILHPIRPVRLLTGELRLPRSEAVVAYMIIGMVLLLSLYNGVIAIKGFSSYDISSDELKVFEYLKLYAKPTDVVLSWWDYGYRLRVYANVTTLADNGTNNSTQMGIVGAMLILPDNESIKLLRAYNVKWIVVYTVDLFKAIWMIRIAEKYAPQYNITEEKYFDKEKSVYKRPFFDSLLWKLLAYGEEPSTVSNWLRVIAEESLRRNPSGLIPSQLVYFKQIIAGDQVKLYKVIYRDEVIPPQPVKGGNETIEERAQIEASISYKSVFLTSSEDILQLMLREEFLMVKE